MKETTKLKTELLRIAKSRAEKLKTDSVSLRAAMEESSYRRLDYNRSRRPSMNLEYLLWEIVGYMLHAELENKPFIQYEREIDSRHAKLLKEIRSGTFYIGRGETQDEASRAVQ